MWNRVKTYREAEEYIKRLSNELKNDFKKHKINILLMCYCTLSKLEKNSNEMKDSMYLESKEKIKKILLKLNCLHIILNLKGKLEKKR